MPWHSESNQITIQYVAKSNSSDCSTFSSKDIKDKPCKYNAQTIRIYETNAAQSHWPTTLSSLRYATMLTLIMFSCCPHPYLNQNRMLSWNLVFGMNNNIALAWLIFFLIMKAYSWHALNACESKSVKFVMSFEHMHVHTQWTQKICLGSTRTNEDWHGTKIHLKRKLHRTADDHSKREFLSSTSGSWQNKYDVHHQWRFWKKPKPRLPPRIEFHALLGIRCFDRFHQSYAWTLQQARLFAAISKSYASGFWSNRALAAHFHLRGQLCNRSL